MFRVLSALITRSTIKTADAIIGTVHVSVWFKFVESCPRSGVYFTVSWPNWPRHNCESKVAFLSAITSLKSAYIPSHYVEI
jgi:hypothetical protein